MLFDNLLILVGIIMVVIPFIWLLINNMDKKSKTKPFIFFICSVIFVSTAFYFLIKTNPYYTISVLYSYEKNPYLFNQITSKYEINTISAFEKDKKLFSSICKNNEKCSKFEIPEINQACPYIKSINILPLYAKPLVNSDPGLYTIGSANSMLSYFNYAHDKDEDYMRYSLIKVNSNDNKPLYYFSSFSIEQTNGMNVIFNKTGKTIVEGKKPEIMGLSQTELNNLISKTVSESCQFYATQNEVTNEWINSEIKK